MKIKRIRALFMCTAAFLFLETVPAQSASVVPYVFREPAAGNDKEMMYNDQGQAAGSDLFFDKGSGRVGLGKNDPEEVLDVNGNVEALYFVGENGPVGVSDASLWNFLSTDNYAGIDAAIQGNVCVGTDCVTGMIFDNHDLVMSENNLRILFDDTSPDGVDWRMVANDSFNGGLNYFGISEVVLPNPVLPFLILAPAVDDGFIIQEQSGFVGVKTANPQSTIQVAGYTQLATTTGSPPGSDCDNTAERGRLIMDDADGSLWICMDSGWVAK